MSVIGEAWVKIRAQTAGFGKEAEGAIDTEMAGVSEAEGRKHGGIFGKAFGTGTGEGMSKLKLAAIAGGAAIGAGVIAGAVGIYKLGETFSDVSDEIRIKTGATGKNLDALNSSFRNVAKQVPESMHESGDAVANLAQKLGLTGKPLENLSVQFLNLAHITKGDVNAQMDATIQLFRNFDVGAKDQAGSLDLLFRASQQSGIGFDELSQQMTQFGPTLRGLGFDFNQSAALIATLNKAGVDASQVMPAMGKAMATAAKEHKSASQVFKETFDRIKNAKTDVDASGVALQVFGARAGPRMAALIREGKLSFDDMLKSLTGGKDTIQKATDDTEHFGEKWDKFKNRVMVGLAPAASAAFDGVGKAMDKIGPVADRVVGKASDILAGFKSAFSGQGVTSDGIVGVAERAGVAFRSFTDDVGPKLQEFGATLSDVFSGVSDFISAHTDEIKKTLSDLAATFSAEFEAIKAIVTVVVNIIMDLWNRFGDTLLGKIKVAIDAIVQIIQGGLELLRGIFDLITAVLTGKWGKAWDAIKEILAGAWKLIVGVLRLGIDEISAVFEAAKAAISAVWSAIWHGIATVVTDVVIDPAKHAFDTLVSFITGLPARIASAAVGMFDGIKDAFKGAINWIIRKWNDLQIKIGGQHVGLPFGLGFDIPTITLNTPDIPYFASGGLVTNKPMVMVGEGNPMFPEYVIPTDPAYRSRARKLFADLGGHLMADGGLIGTSTSSPTGLDALLATLPRGWTIADYVSNLVRAVSISLQSAQLLIVDWVDRFSAQVAATLGDFGGKVSVETAKATKAFSDAGTALGALGSAASSAASAIQSAASQIASAAQQMSQSQPSSGSSSSGSSSYDSTLAWAGGPTVGFLDYFNSQPPDVQSYLLGLGQSQTYDTGGWLMPGTTVARNLTGMPERILSPTDLGRLGGSSRPIVIEQHNTFQGTTEELVGAIDAANARLVDAISNELGTGFAPGSR